MGKMGIMGTMRRRNKYMSADDVKYLILHCRVLRPDNNNDVDDMASRVTRMSSRAYDYHFQVLKDGTMIQHRMLLEVGRHCVRYNRHSISICYDVDMPEGAYTTGELSCLTTGRQWRRVTDLIGILKQLFPEARIIQCG